MFSKTRISYYDNAPNTTIIGNYDDFTIERPENTASYPYLTVQVPSARHGWSYVPLNAYGLYCTFAEIQSLVENNDSFVPEKLEVTIGHTIPLARYPSTANSTQLSFNNTIYSLIATSDDGYLAVNQYIQDNEVDEIVRSFDGVSAVDGLTRSTLPKRNIFFRIPYHSLDTSATPTAAANETTAVWQGILQNVGTNANLATRLQYNQTIRQLIDSYIPELLQNNDNVYTLYPGENQFQREFDKLDPKFCALDCSGPSFNETVWQLDQRLNTLINRDFTDRSASNILSLPILFNLKGNNNDFNPDNFTEGTQAQINTNFNKFTDIYNNRKAIDDYTAHLTKIFVKGVPIVDSDNNLVPHTFCCTITWTLYVKCNPRSDMQANRLQWRMTYPYLRSFQNTDGIVTNQYINMGNFAKKPYRHNVFKRQPMYRFNNLSEAQKTTGFTRGALKNLKKNGPGNIIKSDEAAPDNISPSTFGFTMPFAAGWFEGHAFAANDPIPANTTLTVNTTTAKPK